MAGRPAALDPVDELLARAEQLDASGRSAEALALLEQAAPEGEAPESGGDGAPAARSPRVHYARGTLLFRAGDLGGARACFEEAVRQAPDLPEYRGNLAATYLAEFEATRDGAALDRAVELLEDAVTLGPRTPSCHTTLGVAMLHRGELGRAAQALDEALRIDPQHVPALYDRAAVHHAVGEQEAALALLDRLLTMDPTHPQALRSRCSTLARLGRGAEAAAALEAYGPHAPAEDLEVLKELIAQAR